MHPFSVTSVPLCYFLFSTRHHSARGPRTLACHSFHTVSSEAFLGPLECLKKQRINQVVFRLDSRVYERSFRDQNDRDPLERPWYWMIHLADLTCNGPCCRLDSTSDQVGPPAPRVPTLAWRADEYRFTFRVSFITADLPCCVGPPIRSYGDLGETGGDNQDAPLPIGDLTRSDT